MLVLSAGFGPSVQRSRHDTRKDDDDDGEGQVTMHDGGKE